MTLSAFIKRYNGKSVDYDGYAGAQCVDLARMWIHSISGKQPGPVKGAKDLFAKADASAWTKIRNNSANFPPEGAVVIFNAKPGNPYGHVGIARKGCTKARLLTFDQNWSKPHRCTLETHDYTKDRCLGWLIQR